MKTFFRKFSFIYLLIFVISFGGIVIGVRQLLERYFVDQTKYQTVARLDNFEKLINKDDITLERLSEQFRLLDSYTDSSTWIIDSGANVYGKDIFLSNICPNHKNEITGDFYRVLAGEIIANKHIEPQGYKSLTVLRVGVPMNIHGEVYAVFVSVPFEQIEDTIARLEILILIVLLLSGVLTLAFIYVMTERISSEIELITKSATQIGAGAYDQKIRTRSTDELSRLASAFNQMAESIKVHERARRNFFSSFSHDIRTPLTTIKGYSSGMLDGTIDESNHSRYLGIVVSECDRLLGMANALLDLAKIESGEVGLSMTDFDLNAMVLNVLDSFEKTIMDRNVKMDIDLTHEKVLAHGDYSSMQRVVYNLLDNATKFVNEGGTISIRTELREDRFFVGIGNTGRVLTEEQRKKIFNRFEKLDSSRGIGRSSGLGLAIVKEIIRAHRQSINVYSNEDIGVVFIFTIPTQIFKREVRKDGKA